MLNKNRKLTIDEVNLRSLQNPTRIAAYRKFVDDPENASRINSQTCVVCFYAWGMAGQAFTETNCAKCEKLMQFSETDTDMLCKPCALESRLCKKCGSDMKYKERRRI